LHPPYDSKHFGVPGYARWEHTIRDDRDYASHVDYVHFNPVKHGLVAHPAAWPYSSFHRCVSAGLYPVDWSFGGSPDADWGERR